jgi:YD repeat-containing protein
VTADRDWLQASGRKFPVTIDPTTTITGAVDDCAIIGGTQANVHYCGYTDPTIAMGTHGNGDPRRIFIKFDTSAIPSDATVINADLALNYKTGDPRSNMDLHRVTHDSTSSRTWNTYDGTNSWTPGGSIDSTVAATASNPNTTPGWRHWYPTELVQQWVDGRAPNYGTILYDRTTPPPNDVIVFDSSEATSNVPYMQVRWDLSTGVKSQYQTFDQRLTDRSNLSVNVANGNFMLQNRDMDIAGTNGFDATYGRFYNNKTYFGGDTDGQGWANSIDPVFVGSYGDGASAVLWMPSFAPQVFVRQENGTYKAPTGLEADLINNPSSPGVPASWDVKFHRSGEVWHFDDSGCITQMKDRNGNDVDFAYDASHVLQSITDTKSHTFSFTYVGGKVSTLTDNGSPARVWRYF